jgi:flagellar hook-associated protein 1
VASGESDVAIYLDNAQSGQWLQVMTRDGRHLAGSALSTAQAGLLMADAFGMETGATYSADYLNAPEGQGYLGMDVFIGARGELRQTQQFDGTNGAVLAPIVESAELVAEHVPALASGTVVAAGTFQINGHAMPALTGDGSATAITDWINAETATTGVSASVVDGKLVLSRDDSDTIKDIRLQLGTGSPADLAALGFRTAIHVVGPVTDDLVFSASDFDSSGTNTKPQILADFSDVGDTSAAAKAILRERLLEVEFTSATHYKITDMATGDVMAERAYDNTNTGEEIVFRGLTLSLSSPPATGDRFTIDGNQDGVGNNEAMLAIANLEDDATLMGNGLTMTEAYIERVNNVGSVARQVGIASEALQVVYDQAIETKDGISGVSLDQEAADLVRYQQAYQANAKVMQVASTLFDAILAVR